MPDPNTVSSVSFDDAPGGDLTFDQLFPSDADSVTATAEPQATQTPTESVQPSPAPQPVPQVQAPPDEPFVKGEKTVYKTREAAIDGINQKDAIIEQLRTRFALTTGIDPLTGQPVTAAAPTGPAPKNYAQDHKAYLTDLANAAQKGDPDGYGAAQAKFIYDVLEPVVPILTQTAREQAIRATESDVKDFRTFYGSPEYRAALDSNPELKGAIEFAESDLRNQSRLPGLYKLTYQVSQGMRLPEMLRAQAQQPSLTAQPERTTTPSSTPSLPPPVQTAPNSKVDRKALIAQMEAQGILDRRF
jgi:hypothetical protein